MKPATKQHHPTSIPKPYIEGAQVSLLRISLKNQ